MRSPEAAAFLAVYFVSLGAVPLAVVICDRFARSLRKEPPREAGAITPLVYLLFASGWAFSTCITLPAGQHWVLEVPFYLTIGGIMYFDGVVKRSDPDPGAVVFGVVCVAAVAVGLHLFLRSIAAAAGRVWSAKYTFWVLVLFAMMFGSGVAVTGLIQQTSWMVRTAEPLTHDTRRIP